MANNMFLLIEAYRKNMEHGIGKQILNKSAKELQSYDVPSHRHDTAA